MSPPTDARSRPGAVLRAPLAVALVAALLATGLAGGCGRSKPGQESEISFESLDDTTGLNRGQALLGSFEPYRTANGAVRVRGEMGVPDGTRLQISLYKGPGGEMLARVQFEVRDGQFESPPMIVSGRPLPEGLYHFELLAFFDDAWQPPNVMAATGNGRRLRGPGLTRGRNGEIAFVHTEEHRL